MAQVRFTIDEKVKETILEALKRHGDFEIGGVLIAKKIESNHFQIVDASVSDEGKSRSPVHFIRETTKSQKLLKKHFAKKTGHYAGEWHSHPNFSLTPSAGDILTMLSIINDKDYGASFAVLMIANLNNDVLNYKMYFFHRELRQFVALD